MAKSVTLAKAGRHWKTQTEARAHFSAMLKRYKRGQQVPPGADHNDLAALLELYDETGEKRGSGIASFFLERDIEHGGMNDCFYVKRTDGSQIDFSIHKAVSYVSQKQSAN